MSSITQNIQLKSEEEARVARMSLFDESSVETMLDSVMHVDHTQLLALGLFTYDQIFEAAVSLAKKENDYQIGRSFDVFNRAGLAYGEHVFAQTKSLNPGDSISQANVYAGKYNVAREQITINSELMTDDYTGRQYFEVTRRWQKVSTGEYTAQKFSEKRFGGNRRLRLYVRSLADQTFYIRENNKDVSIALGSPTVYEAIRAQIMGSGVVQTYEETLNGLNEDQIFHLTENKNNQQLFLTVFKQILPNLKAARAAAKAQTSEQ